IRVEALPGPPDSGTPAIDLHEREPLDLGVVLLDPRVEVVAVPSLHGPLEDLHVLHRHRLLREPGGFQGFLLAAEAAKLADSSLEQRNEPSPRHIEGDPAPLATREGSPEHQNPLAEVPKLLGFDPELFPSRVDVVPEPLVALKPAVDDPLRPADDGGTNLNIGIENNRGSSQVPL